jgi:DNA mismatch repair protein MutL
MAIRVLPPELAAQIAAGEVIERPASVVKELVENAIDAGSTAIDVRIENGGIDRIAVRDDGVGMNEDDLRLCIERHATSKLAAASHLQAIDSLGFRGEALASIAAVARLAILSCPRGHGMALRLDARPGLAPTIAPASRPPGTTVEVQDLFAEIPARAKFLGAPRTESFHVGRAIHRLALAFPRIGWSLVHGNRTQLDAHPVDSLIERAAQIYGHTLVADLIPIDLSREDVRVRGLVGPPELHRGHRRDLVFVVNGRPILDRGLSFVVGNAYRGMLRRGTYPLAILRIDLPPDAVDVNVHPRKDEVRFRDARGTQETVSIALQRALSSRYAMPHASLRAEGPADVAGNRQPQAVGERRAVPSRGREPHGLDLDLRHRGGAAADRRSDAERQHRVIGQIRDTYLLVEGPDGLEIVDQHVAHEQVLHAKLRAHAAAGEVPRQRFLLPVRIELPFAEADRIDGHREALSALGVELEAFGGGTFLLREYPAALAEYQARHGFQEAIEAAVAAIEAGRSAQQSMHQTLLASLACAAAVVAGTPLSAAEQQSLVDALMQLEDPYRCPHGRPIVVRIDEEELQRRFARR